MKLSHALNLDKSWRVGLADITLSKHFLNMNDEINIVQVGKQKYILPIKHFHTTYTLIHI